MLSVSEVIHFSIDDKKNQMQENEGIDQLIQLFKQADKSNLDQASDAFDETAGRR
jgi:hypothetical protein